MRNLLTLWRYRSFIGTSIINEFKIRFARSKLGGFWMILQPLSQVLIYAIILSALMTTKLPQVDNRYGYALYLLSGTLAWTLFSEIVTRCLNLFIEKANLLKKMQFPHVTLPFVVLGSSLLNNLMLLVAILVIFAALGHYPSFNFLLWLPCLTIVNAFLALGIGLILGVLNVFIRDLTHIVPILLQLLFWATPIVYPITIIPEHLRILIRYNPLTSMVTEYQQLFLTYQSPVMTQFLQLLAISGIFVCIGAFVFKRANREMVDVL